MTGPFQFILDFLPYSSSKHWQIITSFSKRR